MAAVRDREGTSVGRDWVVALGDCRDLLGEIAAVDHVITDPPYDERTHAGALTSADGGGKLVHFAPIDPADYVPALLRVTRQWCVCFCSLEQLGDYCLAGGFGWVRAGVWDRRSGSAFARSDRPFQGAEGIAIMSRAKVKNFPAGAKRAVWVSTIEREDRVHPTQKPMDLILELLGDFTSPNDLILDPFAGSGTTGVAALRLGRRVILIEQDPKYAAVCAERMQAEEQSSTLSALRAGQEPLFR